MAGLDIFFLDDIRNALCSANEGNSSTVAVAARLLDDPLELRAFREGYKAALCTVAIAFGIAPGAVVGLGHPGPSATSPPGPKEERKKAPLT